MAPAARSEAAGFPGSPVRDARSAEWELMSPLSTARSEPVRIFVCEAVSGVTRVRW